MELDSHDRTPGSDRYRLESSVAEMVGAFFVAGDAHREAEPEQQAQIFSDLVQTLSNWLEGEARKNYRRGLADAPKAPSYNFQPTISNNPEPREMRVNRDADGRIVSVTKE